MVLSLIHLKNNGNIKKQKIVAQIYQHYNKSKEIKQLTNLSAPELGT